MEKISAERLAFWESVSGTRFRKGDRFGSFKMCSCTCPQGMQRIGGIVRHRGKYSSMNLYFKVPKEFL